MPLSFRSKAPRLCSLLQDTTPPRLCSFVARHPEVFRAQRHLRLPLTLPTSSLTPRSQHRVAAASSTEGCRKPVTRVCRHTRATSVKTIQRRLLVGSGDQSRSVSNTLHAIGPISCTAHPDCHLYHFHTHTHKTPLILLV